MAFNTKSIIKDVNGKPVPQYYNPSTDKYEVLEGTQGASKVAGDIGITGKVVVDGQDNQNSILQQIADSLGVTSGNLQDAINMAKEVTKNANDKIEDVEERFNNLTSQQQQDTEVIDARTNATETFDSLKERLDAGDKQLADLEIGGRNYLPLSSMMESPGLFKKNQDVIITNPGNAYTKVYSNQEISTPGIILSPFTLEPDIYTISFDIRGFGGITSLRVTLLGDAKNVFVTNEFQKVSVTLQPNFTNDLLFIYMVYPAIGDGFDIKNIKIEKGNKATDWTPAPEDFKVTMGKAQSAALINGWTGGLFYSKNSQGQVWLRGNIAAGSYTSGTIITTLPADFRPSNNFAILGYCSSSGRVYSGPVLENQGKLVFRTATPQNQGDIKRLSINELYQMEV